MRNSFHIKADYMIPFTHLRLQQLKFGESVKHNLNTTIV